MVIITGWMIAQIEKLQGDGTENKSGQPDFAQSSVIFLFREKTLNSKCLLSFFVDGKCTMYWQMAVQLNGAEEKLLAGVPSSPPWLATAIHTASGLRRDTASSPALTDQC